MQQFAYCSGSTALSPNTGSSADKFNLNETKTKKLEHPLKADDGQMSDPP